MIRTASDLVERNMTAARVLTAPSTRPPAHCPAHEGVALDEGPIHYRCPHGHAVHAADLNREVTL
ncbi:hypothetical protein [Actinomadura rubrisoli]|uniref:Uncharacterized protein n=1 Tax=Actinomadura rubrisoli TaxID=2530368 RepID=A0A4R5CFA0_9ACTN|nr:hypothetical protein [Actinomadura rubrisoli]TDD97689.1 hypothetical protein E1298_01240 [Actinomadura rubrisoli]